MKLSTLIAVATMATVGPAFAADKHGHVHEHAAMHGGVVVEVKDIELELVATPDLIQLHLRDHGKSVDVASGSAKVTLLSGTDKQEVELMPAGDRLEARGNYKVGAGTKLIAVVNLPSKPSTIARFTLK